MKCKNNQEKNLIDAKIYIWERNGNLGKKELKDIKLVDFPLT